MVLRWGTAGGCILGLDMTSAEINEDPLRCGEDSLGHKHGVCCSDVRFTHLALVTNNCCVSAAIMFDAGVASCLERLEAIPWSVDEEEVVCTLSQLQLGDPVTEVLQRVLVESSSSSRADAIFLRLLATILQSKDEKARKDMKALMLGLLREDSDQTAERLHVSRETIYHLCHKCLSSLLHSLTAAAMLDESQRHDRSTLMADIAREADNIQWLLEILISKKMADEFVVLWAEQTELAGLRGKIPSIFRYEISRITAQLCVALGKGEVLVTKETRFAVLRTWLDALYDDFGWMKRASRGFDKRMVEDGLSQMILTLSMAQQQALLLRWFDRFLKKGDECPNIQRAFEVWWRRAFLWRFRARGEECRILLFWKLLFVIPLRGTQIGTNRCMESGTVDNSALPTENLSGVPHISALPLGCFFLPTDVPHIYAHMCCSLLPSVVLISPSYPCLSFLLTAATYRACLAKAMELVCELSLGGQLLWPIVEKCNIEAGRYFFGQIVSEESMSTSLVIIDASSKRKVQKQLKD
ncbi:BTB/POZ domain-containing protein [Platanthera guangdongensis]|uniref:BTB/POZ domain-containing protein n=1 Tax=Platanthera guangdongensis TaxID=2320717 RepID=A0ABR2MHC1_9ASPA